MKRINKEALFVLTAFIISFAFVNFICIALPALKVTYETSSFLIVGKVDGLIATFGGTVSNGSTTNNFNLLDAKYNALSLYAYLIPLVSCILTLVGLSKKKQILYYISGIICLACGVITLLEGVIFSSINNTAMYGYEVSLLIGPIIGGICGVIAGIACFGSWYIFNKKQ
jgi:hypothetical protein